MLQFHETVDEDVYTNTCCLKKGSHAMLLQAFLKLKAA